jgi:hypothetical protein
MSDTTIVSDIAHCLYFSCTPLFNKSIYLYLLNLIVTLFVLAYFQIIEQGHVLLRSLTTCVVVSSLELFVQRRCAVLQ